MLQGVSTLLKNKNKEIMLSAELQLTQEFHQDSNISTRNLIFKPHARDID